MAQDPAFLMYYKQWLVSTAGWDADIRGWYINLLCHQADKPEGLPSDLESIAELAGVKISQYERFKECWKRTLEAKFKATSNGTLVNKKQQKVIADRLEFTEKQTKRGLIGYFIKLARSNFDISDETASELYKALELEELVPKSREERFDAFKRTLEALMRDVNVNVIVDSIKGGMGENKKTKTNGKQFKNFKAQGEETIGSRLQGFSHILGSGEKNNT